MASTIRRELRPQSAHSLEKLATTLTNTATAPASASASSKARPSSAKARPTAAATLPPTAVAAATTTNTGKPLQRPATAGHRGSGNEISRRTMAAGSSSPPPSKATRGGPRPGSSARVRSAWKEQQQPQQSSPPPTATTPTATATASAAAGLASQVHSPPTPTADTTTTTVEGTTTTPLSVSRGTSSSPTKAGSPSKAKAGKKATFGKSNVMVEPTAGPSGEITSLTEGEYQRLLLAWKEVDYTQNGVLPCAKVLDVLRWARLPVDVNLIQRLDRERKPQVDFMDFLKLCFPSISAHNRLHYAKIWGKPCDRSTRGDAYGGTGTAWWAKFDPQALSELVQIYMLYARAGSPASSGSSSSTGETTSPRSHRGGGGSPRSSSELRGISREALRAAIPRRNLDDATLNDIFSTYDVDGDNLLNLPEFAVVMEDVYLQPEKAAPEVKLFFQ